MTEHLTGIHTFIMSNIERIAGATTTAPWLRPMAGAWVALMLTVTTGCGTLVRNPVPPELTTTAVVPGMPDVRAWAGHASPALQDDMVLSYKQESRADFPVGADGRVQYTHLLLSGGGANGAFGSGLLNGWTKTGTRPVFKIVTGVSTGALMAPYAFLGPKYDDALRDLYTTTRSQNIFVSGSLFGMISQLFFGEALADTGPLASMIAQHVDEQFVREVAAAHSQGRRLYIGTVDLDAQRFIVWNMGLIAQANYPDKVRLFRKVMLASASIPVVFPPVFFDVKADGRLFDEMHVDGGVVAMVFFSAGLFSPLGRAADRGRRARLRPDLRDPQRPAGPADTDADTAHRPRHFETRAGSGRPFRRDWRPVPHLHDRAAGRGRVPLGHDSGRREPAGR